MDHSDDKTADFERRTSQRMSRQVSVHASTDLNDSTNNDAYLAAMGITVSDGYRPSDNTPPTPIADTEEPETSSASATSTPPQPSPTSQPIVAARGRPSSIAKPPIGSLSLASASSHNAHASGSRAIGSSSSQPAANVRESTASSVAPIPQQDEPYQGPSGPSFPYGMYPQNVGVTRTPSTVTTSTATPSETSYNGPRGPAFPYAMYPQGTMAGVAGIGAVSGEAADVAAGPSTVPTSAIPVGFPGMTDNYQRRIGPDGEDAADLIGPDGHTEQLPPYTRYPDEAYTRKIASANEPQRPDPLTNGPMLAPSSVPVAGMFPNTVPIEVETMAAVPSASTPEPAAAPVSLASSSSVNAANPAHAAPTPTVPAPALVTPAAAIVPPAETIPGAGGLGLAPRNPEFDGAEEAGSPRVRYSLRSFNSDGTSAEINTAARGMSEKRKPTCIQRYGGRRILGIIPYWAICLVLTAILIMCIILGVVVGIFVTRHKRAQSRHGSGNAQSVTVMVDATPIPTPSNLPGLPTGTFALPLQSDQSPTACFDDTTQAQAWSCNIPYQYSLSMTINSLSPTPDGPLYNISIDCNMSATVANDVYYYGEQAPVMPMPMPMQLVNDTLDPNRGPAWFKMLPYNKTVVVHETYLSAPATDASDSTSNKKRMLDNMMPASLVWGQGGSPFHRDGVVPAQAGEKPWICTWPDTVLEVFIYPNQNTSLSKGMPSKISHSPTYTSTTRASTETVGGIRGTTATPTTSTVAGPSSTGSFPNGPPPGPPLFPRVVKVEERRMAKSPRATCIQYELKDEGFGIKGMPYLDANGDIIEITISEIESGPSLFSRSESVYFGSSTVFDSDAEEFDKRDNNGLSKCGCLWMVT